MNYNIIITVTITHEVIIIIITRIHVSMFNGI